MEAKSGMIRPDKTSGIRSWPEDTRPKEKLLRNGAGALIPSISNVWCFVFLSTLSRRQEGSPGHFPAKELQYSESMI